MYHISRKIYKNFACVTILRGFSSNLPTVPLSIYHGSAIKYFITLPVAGEVEFYIHPISGFFSFFSLFFLCRKLAQRSWVIPLGISRVSQPKHSIKTQFLAEYVNKTCILTCMLEHLNHKKVLRAKILLQNVLKQQIPVRNFTKEPCIAVKF